MGATVSGVHQVVFALREHGADMERGVQDEMAVVAQFAVRAMRRKAAKGPTSNLVNSIKADQVEPAAHEIGPHTNYGQAVEEGVPAGKKGLPRYFDPQSKSIVDWLKSTAFPGQHKATIGTKALQDQETELRDRYEGLAWHIRHFGVKAQPFVKPTADEMAQVLPKRLELAVRRVLAARPSAGGATA